MKTFNKLLCLALSASLLSGCSIISNIINGGGQSSTSNNSSQNGSSSNSSSGENDSSSSSGSSSSSSSQGGGGGETTFISDWTSATKELMMTYCGEVLPVARFKTGYVAKASETDDGYYLEMYDNHSSFTISNYGTSLENNGWYVYEDDDYEDSYYAEKTSASGEYFYLINFYYYSGYGNCIDCNCYEMSTELTDNTEWTADDIYAMEASLTEAIPFMKFGKEYEVKYQGDYFQLVDGYYQDLTKAYCTLISTEGYTYAGLDEYGDPLYVKTIADGGTITINPYYVGGTGNVIYAFYTPETHNVNEWPSDVLAPIESATGYAIPSFGSGPYTYFTKEGAIIIYNSGTVSLEEEYATALENNGLIVSDGYAESWEENLYIAFEDTGDYDDDYNFIVDGFSISVQQTISTSIFSDNYPVTEASAYCATNYGFTGSVPAASDFNSPHRQFRYFEIEMSDALVEQIYNEEYIWYVAFGLYTEEEAMQMAREDAEAYVGFYVQIYDPNQESFDAFLSHLSSIPYYVEGPYSNGGYYSEDADGTYGLYMYKDGAVFTIQYVDGSNETHSPSLTISKTEASGKPGTTIQLSAAKSMIADAISWESSNESVATVNDNGLVTISSSADFGQTTTITVSAGTYNAQCVVTVVDTAYYVKVTSTADVTSGEYLIVYNGSSLKCALDGGRTSIDAASNYVSVTITDEGIEATEEMHAAAFNIVNAGANGFTISSQTGVYIGRENSGNGLDSSESTLYNTITINDSGKAIITGASGAKLQFNNQSGQNRFRYYTSTQQPIELYKLG